MSHWRSDWQRLRERLKAHDRALQSTAHGAEADEKHQGALLQLAAKESREILGEVSAFVASHGPTLPERALAGLTELGEFSELLTDFDGPRRLASASAVLSFKLASIDYYLADRESRLRSIVERAFLHLDRLIVADEQVREKWLKAFAEGGEAACEQLGGAHLLHHGLWAFKSYAPGERTDLVLGTVMSHVDIERAAEAAEAMVLTEWKVAPSADKVPKKFEEARTQAKRYAEGSLAGFELHSTRYAVTVAHDRAPRVADVVEGSVSYRHLHVAVKPPPPHEVSRKAKSTHSDVADAAGTSARRHRRDG